eukprot:181881-Rhodomonas_salina.1
MTEVPERVGVSGAFLSLQHSCIAKHHILRPCCHRAKRGSGCRVEGIRVERLQIHSLGSRVSGLGSRVSGLGSRV